jgi:hypothetical protein
MQHRSAVRANDLAAPITTDRLVIRSWRVDEPSGSSTSTGGSRSHAGCLGGRYATGARRSSGSRAAWPGSWPTAGRDLGRARAGPCRRARGRVGSNELGQRALDGRRPQDRDVAPRHHAPPERRLGGLRTTLSSTGSPDTRACGARWSSRLRSGVADPASPSRSPQPTPACSLRLAFLARRLIEQLTTPPPEPPPGVDELTPRELEILRHVARGLSNSEIADELIIARLLSRPASQWC